MLTLPDAIISVLRPFSTLFRDRTWSKAQLLLVGAILAPRKRTVTSALQVKGLSDDTGFARYHHVLNRAKWSPLKLSRVLLLLLIQWLGQGGGPLVFGIDETLERRRGKRIKAKGIYRDGVRSSGSHFVKASALRWVSLMWLTTIPWAPYPGQVELGRCQFSPPWRRPNAITRRWDGLTRSSPTGRDR